MWTHLRSAQFTLYSISSAACVIFSLYDFSAFLLHCDFKIFIQLVYSYVLIHVNDGDTIGLFIIRRSDVSKLIVLFMCIISNVSS